MTFFTWEFCWEAKPSPHRSRCKCHGKLHFSPGWVCFHSSSETRWPCGVGEGLSGDWDMTGVVAASTNGVIDLCTCWQLQKNQRKFTHILHTIVLRNKPALLHFPLLYLYSGVTEPAANQPDLLLPKANSEWHMGLAGVAGSLSHWTRIMRLSRCQASAALI